jgi:putative ABC transport system substrate-binding protein
MLEHDPEKWVPVFGKDHAPRINESGMVASPGLGIAQSGLRLRPEPSRGSAMRRREFIAALTGAAAWPFLAHAQGVPVVGLLNAVAFEGPYAVPVAAIRRGLEATGFVEGQNLAIEYRSARGAYERLPELATDLIRNGVTAIVAIGVSTPALASMAAASPIPIVFAVGLDAAEVGVIDRLNRPEANVGASATAGPASDRVGLLLDLRPRGTSLVGYLDNSRRSEAFDETVESVTATARRRGRELAVFDAGTEEEVAIAFNQMALRRVRSLVVGPDPFLMTRHEQIIALAAQSTMPAIYATRGAVMLGGLMSYGVLTNDMYRVAGVCAGRILKGATPAELPVVLPTRFELVINKTTAKALRINVPGPLLARADAIFE